MRPQLIAVLALIVLSPNAMAQKHKKKPKEEEKIPVYNVVIDDPMDVFGRQQAADEVHTVLLPEFASAHVRNVGDTVYFFEFYDAAHQFIRPDTLMRAAPLQYVSLIRTYTDPHHTYKDGQGKDQPLPIKKIMDRYDKTGTDKWMNIDYDNKRSATLQGFPAQIVRTDSATVIDPIRNNSVITVYNYYKVVEVK